MPLRCAGVWTISNRIQARQVSNFGGQVKRTPKKKEKPSAAAMAARLSVPAEQKKLIEILAGRFDMKRFLPAASDVRYFFEVNNQPVPVIKQRAEAFRKILRLLATMPTVSLQRLVEEEAHCGPASSRHSLRPCAASESSEEPRDRS